MSSQRMVGGESLHARDKTNVFEPFAFRHFQNKTDRFEVMERAYKLCGIVAKEKNAGV
jgi:hypothetical protein